VAIAHYQEYAPFYDGSGQMRFAILMDQYLSEVLARHLVAGRRALDLACGTGTLALLLANAGWEVVGLDASAEMLAQAKAKAANLETRGSATFVLGDMRTAGIENEE
jgi:ubiquinone/menaquinone biosynthesis C-methylase UbiE